MRLGEDPPPGVDEGDGSRDLRLRLCIRLLTEEDVDDVDEFGNKRLPIRAK